MCKRPTLKMCYYIIIQVLHIKKVMTFPEAVGKVFYMLRLINV